MYENEILDHYLSYKIQNNTTGIVVNEVEDTVMNKKYSNQFYGYYPLVLILI
jgi:hypothetical protein